MYKALYLVTSAQSTDKSVAKLKETVADKLSATQVIAFEDFDFDKALDGRALYLLHLDDAQIKTFLSHAMGSRAEVAILANERCIKSVKAYDLNSDPKEVIDQIAQGARASCIDILTCNEKIVFSSVIIGDVYGINSEVLPNDSALKRFKRFVKNLKRVRFHPYAIKAKNGETVNTAATGIMVYEHNLKNMQDEFVNEDISLHDGQMNALILAPKSIFAYLYLLFVIFFYKRFSLTSLPKSMGLIKSGKLGISSGKSGIDFLIDGVSVSAKEINLQVNKEALYLHLNAKTENTREKKENSDTIDAANLPKGEYKTMLLKNALPLFKKAEYEDFKELFINLKAASKIGGIYTVLMIVSTLLATVGLFQNSTPVIIGAMILAPLMSPIVSFSMGVVRSQSELMQSSLVTIVFGVAASLLFAALFTMAVPIKELTPQMQMRLQPNLFDMFVAIFSGIAAAYANAKEQVAKSLAGVAIAVALVPPLAVTGIGIGWMDFEVMGSSFLLFVTNFVGITMAASVTFIVLGFAPLHRAKRGVIYTLVAVVAVSWPLAIAFMDIVWQNNMNAKLSQNTEISVASQPVEYTINSITKQKDQKIVVDIDIYTPKTLDQAGLLELKRRLEEKLGTQVRLLATQKIQL
ncbi:MAG: TIGR00341 family protein [Campylobacterota bacterium]